MSRSPQNTIPETAEQQGKTDRSHSPHFRHAKAQQEVDEKEHEGETGQHKKECSRYRVGQCVALHELTTLTEPPQWRASLVQNYTLITTTPMVAAARVQTVTRGGERHFLRPRRGALIVPGVTMT